MPAKSRCFISLFVPYGGRLRNSVQRICPAKPDGKIHVDATSRVDVSCNGNFTAFATTVPLQSGNRRVTGPLFSENWGVRRLSLGKSAGTRFTKYCRSWRSYHKRGKLQFTCTRALARNEMQLPSRRNVNIFSRSSISSGLLRMLAYRIRGKIHLFLSACLRKSTICGFDIRCNILFFYQVLY